MAGICIHWTQCIVLKNVTFIKAHNERNGWINVISVNTDIELCLRFICLLFEFILNHMKTNKIQNH